MNTKEGLTETAAPRPVRHDRPVDWNVVVTLPEDTFREAQRLLARWGRVRRTHYFNVLAMTATDPLKFLNEFAAEVSRTPGLLNFISHVVPAQATFDFDSVDEFEARARDIIRGWAARLADKSFYIRLHRRGFKGTLSTHHEERRLGDSVIAILAAAGTPGRIAFDNPDAMIQIETIDGRAGLSLWTRDELQRCRFLGPG